MCTPHSTVLAHLTIAMHGELVTMLSFLVAALVLLSMLKKRFGGLLAAYIRLILSNYPQACIC